MDDRRLLAIYLQDHRALLVAARELTARMGRSAPSAGERAFAQALHADLVDDLTAVDALLARLGRRPDRAKAGAAWLAERAGRLKLNGRILQRSPLSAVTELEGCRMLLESVRALWTGVALHHIAPGDAAARGERALRHLEVAETLRQAAIERAVVPR